MAQAEENEAKGLLPDGSKDLKRQNDFMSSGEETDSNVSLLSYSGKAQAISVHGLGWLDDNK